MIGGGGVLNWSYLQKGLVDEVSIIMAPLADGTPDMQTLFMAKEPLSSVQAIGFTPIEVKIIEEGTIWLRFKVKNDEIDK